DILDSPKIEAGKIQLDHITFMLRDALGDALKALALPAQQKGLELACHILPDVPDAVTGDPGRLRQIVINLVGNALKFTERGEVVVEVRRQATESGRHAETGEHQGKGPAEPAACRPPSADCLLHFAVRDTGIGIPPERQRLIFEAFAQADASTTRKYGGTGLGLTISSRLVELIGGRLWVESAVGQGST